MSKENKDGKVLLLVREVPRFVVDKVLYIKGNLKW